MATIFHTFTIKASRKTVFDAITNPKNLDCWWSKQCSGVAETGGEYHFHFGPEYDWTAEVTVFIPDRAFELEFKKADEDWKGSKTGFNLTEAGALTEVKFYHTGWKAENEHFCISNFCWAMYLRLLKRFVEKGEVVDYEERLKV